jgi:Na+-translocating ferredoxin:NAD+ oxidoreductase RnfE subunit
MLPTTIFQGTFKLIFKFWERLVGKCLQSKALLGVCGLVWVGVCTSAHTTLGVGIALNLILIIFTYVLYYEKYI